MKIGFRKPSVKKSIKARTTGKIERQVKKSVNPFYDKKGMGYINDPKKAVYNKVYNKTTFGTTDVINAANKTNSKNSNHPDNYNISNSSQGTQTRQKRKKVHVPIGEHKTNTLDRILIIISGILIYGAIFFVTCLLFSGSFLRFCVIAEAVIIVILIVFACTQKTTTDYKTVYEDELTKDDVNKLQSVNPNYSDKIKREYSTHLTVSQLNREVEILNNCATLMEKTNNIDTFFERYKLYMEKLTLLSDAEKCRKFNFEGDSPTKQLIEYQTESKRTQLFNEFIDRAWRKVCEKAETMKTERGKENQYKKFESLMKSHENVLTPASINYYKSKLNKK